VLVTALYTCTSDASGGKKINITNTEEARYKFMSERKKLKQGERNWNVFHKEKMCEQR
jgi:hypothetical protein